jgi:hypothetical protein
MSGSRRTALYAADAGGTGPAVFSIPKLQTRIDRLAFQGEDTEDANRNITNDGQNSIVYDGENRVQSTSGSLGTATHTYEASGHRVVKVSGSSTTSYIYAGNNVVAEYVNGTLGNEYAHMGGKLLASHVSGTLYFHHRDLQSIRVTRNAIGTKVGGTRTFSVWRILVSHEHDEKKATYNLRERYRVRQ